MSEMGTRGLGTAGAGRVVLAADASTDGKAAIDQECGPQQGSLKGEYDSNATIFFAVNLIWKI